MVARKKTSRGAGNGASTSTDPPFASTPGDYDEHATAAAAAAAADPSSEPVYFWRPSGPETGFLSQWWYSPFRDRADPSRKAVLFGDPAVAARILAAAYPSEARVLGRVVANFDDAVWKRERARIVFEANWCKFALPVGSLPSGFSYSPEGDEERLGGKMNLKDALLATGDRPLVEASPWDRIWGIGFNAANAEKNRRRWGLNLLGKCLMEVREQLRLEEQEKSEARKRRDGKVGGSDDDDDDNAGADLSK
ncbi:Phosphatidylglycerol/phosphatidylinositol transfer protein [Hypoxylon texense]